RTFRWIMVMVSILGAQSRRATLRIIIAIFLGFLVAIAADAKSAQAQDGVITFTFTNDSSHIIFMKMFSQNRRWIWPDGSSHYVLDDNQPKSARLACNVGEKICFGGAWTANDRPVYWGVGYRGNKECQGCCLICGTEEDNGQHAW